MRCRQCQKLLNAIARVGVVFCVACLVGSAHGHDPHPVHDRYTGDTLPNYATTASSSTRSTESFKLNWGRLLSSSKNNHMDDLRANIAQKEELLVSLESGKRPRTDFTGRQQLVVDDLGNGDGLDRAGRAVAESGDDGLADLGALGVQLIAARSRAVAPGAALGDDRLGADLAEGVE